jgi:chitin disaccharide deacetylase
MKKAVFITALLLITCYSQAQQRNLAELLGYDASDRLLIIHGDDIGLAHAKNAASLKAMLEGVVNSASIQMPCAWSTEVGEIVKAQPDLDIGIHLTLTNEWFNYKWRPVSPQQEVPNLIGENNFMHPDCATVAQLASPEEVEKEMRAQIEAAIQIGIQPTHLDSHMGCIYSGRPEFMASYLKLAQEYGIPAMVSPQMWDSIIIPNVDLFENIDLKKIPLVHIATASPAEYDNMGMDEYYTQVLNNLPAGVTALLIHLAYDNEEMQAITVRHTHWHAPWRQDDFDFFMSDKAKRLIKENNIKLVTWREIGDVMKKINP